MTVAYPQARSNLTIKDFSGDAMHVRKNNTTVSSNNIIDNYSDSLQNVAHRDGIQIIPFKQGEPYYQFAGGVSKDIVVTNNFIYSENGLQGIFASDGGHCNLQILRNHIVTDSPHKISIAGMFSGVIHDNRNKDLSLCKIQLFPLRIGGNSDGTFNVWIIHFRNSPFRYEPLKNILNTKPYAHVMDNRTASQIRSSKDIYLHSFNYIKFRSAVSNPDIAFTPNDLRDLALDFGKQDT